MVPWKAVARGFLLAPLVPGLLVWCLAVFWDAGPVDTSKLLTALTGGAFLFVYTIIATYVVTVILALPAYAICWANVRVGLVTCLIGGVLIGGGIFLIPFLLQLVGLWPTWDQESLGGTALIVDRKFTPAGIAFYLSGVGEAALYGAAVAFMFWLLAVRDRPALQCRREMQ